MADSPFLPAALAYAERGWPVLPCSPRDKTPLVKPDKGEDGKPIKGTGGVRKASRDAEQIRGWWKRWPNAMIGLAMGSNGLFAVDFDPRVDDATGEEWPLDRLKAELEAQMHCAFPPSLAVRTPSGGVHVYFAQPATGDPIRNRGNLPEHVDVRGAGGYVIAPPSCMADGRRYRWLRGAEDAPIAAPPVELVAILQTRKAAKPKGGAPSDGGAGGSDDAARRYALAALDGECRAIQHAPSGKRQDALNVGAFNVAQLVGAGALTEATGRAAVLQAALANPGQDDERQIVATIDSGWAAGLANPRDLSGVGASASRPPPRRAARLQAVNDPPLQSASESEALNRRLCMRPMTDLGNAERFAARYGDRVRYVEKMGWMAYDGRRYILDGAEALIGGWVQETVRAIREEARVMRESGRRDQGDAGALDDLVEVKRDDTEVLLSDKLAAWAKASESANRLGCIAGLAKNLSGAGLTVQPEQLDRNPFLINVLNGTLELHRSGDRGRWAANLTLRPHSAADLITRLVPVEYRPRAVCPVYDAFLSRVQPADDMRRFLHQWGGLSLTGDVSEQKLAFFHGKGANGKSTLVDIWATIAGDYAGTVPIETFLDQGRKRKGSDASPDLAALVGVRMLRTSEPERGSKLAEALIKLATGGEPFPVRKLNRDPFDLHPAFKLTASGNHRPSIGGTDDGIWRRVLLVPWEVQIPDAERDRGLLDKLKAEASGILNRLLNGALDWRVNGLCEPESVRGATTAYREESDPLGRFLASCTQIEKDARAKSSHLYALFLAWAKAAGEREWTQTGFSRAMTDRGFRKIESHGMRWLDLEMIRTPADFDQPDAPPDDDGSQSWPSHSPSNTWGEDYDVP